MHMQNLRTFFAFCPKKQKTKKKRCVKAWVLREFLLLLFNTVSLFFSALFRKTKVFCLATKASNQHVHISISKGCKGCRSQGPCTVAGAGCIKSCSAKHAAQREDSRMGRSQTLDKKIGKFSSNSNICYFYLKLIASIGKTLSLKCFQISLTNIKSVRHN